MSSLVWFLLFSLPPHIRNHAVLLILPLFVSGASPTFSSTLTLLSLLDCYTSCPNCPHLQAHPIELTPHAATCLFYQAMLSALLSCSDSSVSLETVPAPPWGTQGLVTGSTCSTRLLSPHLLTHLHSHRCTEQPEFCSPACLSYCLSFTETGSPA